MSAASAEEMKPDPDRIFVTPLKWERIQGAPRSVKERWASGMLAVLYADGTYAEAQASFSRGSKRTIGLNLNEGFIIRLGSWSRTYDDRIIRVEARETLRDKIIIPMKCKTTEGKQVCEQPPEAPLPGPIVTHTCRLERPSSTHIADAIVCSGGSTFVHARERIGMSDFPDIVKRAIAAEPHP